MGAIKMTSREGDRKEESMVWIQTKGMQWSAFYQKTQGDK